MNSERSCRRRCQKVASLASLAIRGFTDGRRRTGSMFDVAVEEGAL